MHRCDCDPVIRHMYQEIASEPHSKHPSGPNHRTQVSSERASVLTSTCPAWIVCQADSGCATLPVIYHCLISFGHHLECWFQFPSLFFQLQVCSSAHTHNSAPYRTSVESVAFAVSIKNAFTNRVNKWKAHRLQLGQHIKHASLLWQQLRNFATLDSTKHVWMSENLPAVRNARQGEEDKNRCEMVPGRWARYMPMDSASKR